VNYEEYKYLILSDLYRITADVRPSVLIRHVLRCGTYQYNFWLRTWRFTKSNPWLRYPFHALANLMLHRLTYKFGIAIPPETDIGPGFYIGHFGGIVVNSRAVIGKNCNISHGVTLGQANRGKNKGFPVIGDNVYIGPGAKIIGAVKIGNNAAAGANCVVTKDVPDHAVVAGVPGRIISQAGSEGYVNNTGYEEILRAKVS